jgi:predicted RNase H-like HicB family nuclease
MHHTIAVKWSERNQAYVVILPEWEGRYLMPVTDGATYEEAVRKGAEVLETIIEDARAHGDSLPEPATFEAASS